MNRLNKILIHNVYICLHSQKLTIPASVGYIIPNSLKLVTSCSYFYTFCGSLSGLPLAITYEPFLFSTGRNILQQVKSLYKAGYSTGLQLRRTGGLCPNTAPE